MNHLTREPPIFKTMTRLAPPSTAIKLALERVKGTIFLTWS
ncbi:hypothetical protein [Pseudomonas fluorescens]